MVRYWYDPETDDYASTHTLGEASVLEAAGYREIDRITFDDAMRSLK